MERPKAMFVFKCIHAQIEVYIARKDHQRLLEAQLSAVDELNRRMELYRLQGNNENVLGLKTKIEELNQKQEEQQLSTHA